MTTTEESTGRRLEPADLVDHCDGILSEPRRRYLLYCLCFYQNPMSLPAIADQVTVWEDDGASGSYEQRRLRVYGALYHDHLPVLESGSIVEYHQADDSTTLGPQAGRLKPVVRTAFENEFDELLQAEGQSMRHNNQN